MYVTFYHNRHTCIPFKSVLKQRIQTISMQVLRRANLDTCILINFHTFGKYGKYTYLILDVAYLHTS